MACRVQTAEMRTTLRACKPCVVLLFIPIEANSQALPLTCEEFMIKSLSPINQEPKHSGVATGACFPFNQSVIHVGHVLASPVVESKLLPG